MTILMIFQYLTNIGHIVIQRISNELDKESLEALIKFVYEFELMCM